MNKQISREKIIDNIKNVLFPNKYVHALWLEGSDGLNKTDEYSDIDIVVDVDDDYVEEIFNLVETSLKTLGDFDFIYKRKKHHPKLEEKIYHINNSLPYLLIDFTIQSHSRNKNESTFYQNDLVEAGKILFDKSSVVTINKVDNFDIKNIKDELISTIEELNSRYHQHSRVIKYVRRNQYLEAYIYYMKYVVEPLVILTRIKYTPKYYYINLIHISNHIPEQERLMLEHFYQVSCLEDIEMRTNESILVFNKLVNEVEASL